MTTWYWRLAVMIRIHPLNYLSLFNIFVLRSMCTALGLGVGWWIPGIILVKIIPIDHIELLFDFDFMLLIVFYIFNMHIFLLRLRHLCFDIVFLRIEWGIAARPHFEKCLPFGTGLEWARSIRRILLLDRWDDVEVSIGTRPVTRTIVERPVLLRIVQRLMQQRSNLIIRPRYTLLQGKIRLPRFESFLRCYLFHLIHLLFLPDINGWQMILNNPLLPISDHALPLVPRLVVVHVFYVKSCVILEVPDGELYKFECKWLISFVLSDTWHSININMSCWIACIGIATKETPDYFVFAQSTIWREVTDFLRLCNRHSLGLLLL